jgi:hypothetical protein
VVDGAFTTRPGDFAPGLLPLLRRLLRQNATSALLGHLSCAAGLIPQPALAGRNTARLSDPCAWPMSDRDFPDAVSGQLPDYNRGGINPTSVTDHTRGAGPRHFGGSGVFRQRAVEAIQQNFPEGRWDNAENGDAQLHQLIVRFMLRRLAESTQVYFPKMIQAVCS